MRKLLPILLLLSLCQGYQVNKPILGRQVDWGHPLARGLVGFWLMNEGGGNSIYDLSGNGNNGTLVGDTSWVAGKSGPCLSFDGTGDYVDTGWDAAGELTEMTMAIWFKPGRIDTQYLIDQSSGSAGFALRHTSALSGFAYVGGSPDVLSGGTISSAAGWYYGVYTIDGSSSHLYLNGKLVDSGTGGAVDDSAGAMAIGAEYDGDVSFLGSIDNVTIYNRALTESEIASLYRDQFQMFERPKTELLVTAGEAPPAGDGQVIMIMMSSLSPLLAIGIIVGAFCYGTKRAA